MISPKLYKNSRIYDFCLKSFGFERSVDRFLRNLVLPFSDNVRILDVGCGTGLMGLHFLDRFAEATLCATDLESNFLDATLQNAQKRHINASRIRLGVSDISQPKNIRFLSGNDEVLPDGVFDLICVGAAIGYSTDAAATTRGLIDLMAPGGRLINLEMSESLIGKYVSRRYRYNNPIAKVMSVMTQAGCQVSEIPLGVSHFPAKLTRTALVARKTV